MIVSFGDKPTESLYHGTSDQGLRRLPPEVISRALNKLEILNAAHDVKDLRSPPGNRLEALEGDFKGFHSIRVNNQWRIVFRWKDGNAFDARLTDYH
jgi:proteic killer suppression protein